MASYTYFSATDPNLICCICRMPFVNPATTRTCAHTFCQECILRAISIAPQCPVDRSDLVLEDVLPASPLVRNMVDELVVECQHRELGCMHTSQRYLLASHLKDSCDYEQVQCPEGQCDQLILRKDNNAHICGQGVDHGFDEVRAQAEDVISEASTVTCSACSSSILRSELSMHSQTCPSVTVDCTHASHGCPWTGPRAELAANHISSCAYETIKGFFAIHESRFAGLSEENIVLRHKVDALEGLVRAMQRELLAVKNALGPWYRPNDPRALSSPSASNLPERLTPPYSDPSPVAVTPDAFPFAPNPYLSAALDGSVDRPTTEVDLLAPYFASLSLGTTSFTSSAEQGPTAPQLHRLGPMRSPAQAHTQFATPLSDGFFPRSPPSAPAGSGTRPTAPYSAAAQVAPLNLGATLEGTLAGLRASVVSLASALDSLERRAEIAQTSETLRANEEIGTLRVVVHGLRMQVHSLMMDRNAQVTGRAGDGSQSPLAGSSWLDQPPPPGAGLGQRYMGYAPFALHPQLHPSLSSASITKL